MIQVDDAYVSQSASGRNRAMRRVVAILGDEVTYDYGRWVARAVERAHGIKTSHNLCLSCGHSIDAHDRQYGCAEDGCDCECQRRSSPGRPSGRIRCSGELGF